MSESSMDLLIVIVILVFLAGPIMAIVALVGINRLQDSLAGMQFLTSRLIRAEQRLEELEKALKAGASVSVSSSSEGASPVATPQAAAPIPIVPPASLELPPPPAPPPSQPVEVPPSIKVSHSDLGRSPAPGSGEDGSSSFDLETVIAGKLFSRVGIVALLIAVSYGLKYAFDNHWIGPSGRVAIGVLLGALMLPWSQLLLGRGYTYFSEGIAALGEATLFLSVWTGCQYYTLYSRDVGFLGMIGITAVMAAVSIGRNSQRIAVLSLLGGLLTPILASSGKNQETILFSYLLLLGAAALALVWRKGWSWLAPIGFLGTVIYFWGWYGEFYKEDALEKTLLFAALFFLLYELQPALRAVRGAGFDRTDTAIVLLNICQFSAAAFSMLWPEDKWPLTLLCIALAAGHVAIARFAPEDEEDRPRLPKLLFAGLALTLLTLAVPVRLEGKWITLSFSVEGAILVWTGFRTLSNGLRQAGYFLLALSTLRLLVLPPDGGAFLFNERFAAYLVLIACLGVALWSARSYAETLGRSERAEVGIFGVAINVLALIALSIEFWDRFGGVKAGIDAEFARHLSLSILWTVYATVLLILGMREKSSLIRWQALALFVLVVGKVFFYDSAFLERGYRILSFFVLGAVLLGVSFFYHRKLVRNRETA